MTKISIEWKHFDKDGVTCDRCSQTGLNLLEAIKELKEQNFDIDYTETKLTQDQMSQSNQILINGLLIEDLLTDAKVGESYCSSCTDLTDNASDCHCRTINQSDTVFEEIPKDLIKNAILTVINFKKNMKIQVLGSGCPSCKNLYELTQTAVRELGIDAKVEYSTDISKIIELGVMEAPAMTINGRIAMLGSGSLDKVKEIILKAKDLSVNQQKSDDNCSCTTC